MNLISFVFLVSQIFGVEQPNSNEIRVLAKLISYEVGSEIHIAEFQLIEELSGSISSDTFTVGYHFYNSLEEFPEIGLLTLLEDTGTDAPENYYTFPEYDSRKGIESVKLLDIDFDYWEGCETGERECKPIKLSRKNKIDNLFIKVPCGWTTTTVQLFSKNNQTLIEEVIANRRQCPIIFDFTNLPDKEYYFRMFACGLGGQIEIDLKTNFDE